jgi:Transglycosylase SLT domain
MRTTTGIAVVILTFSGSLPGSNPGATHVPPVHAPAVTEQTTETERRSRNASSQDVSHHRPDVMDPATDARSPGAPADPNLVGQSQSPAEPDSVESVITPPARLDPAVVIGPDAEPHSKEVLCTTLASSARENALPLAFFGNLIWQESRFRPSAVSPAGAQGIAQFMPKTAAAFGLKDPFDPFQALPASARLLRELLQQFGNLGLAAAAYNAGPGRVLKWLAKAADLPRETRDYVRIITGRTAEEWRGEVAHGDVKVASALPCRKLAAYSALDDMGDRPERTDRAAPSPRNRFAARITIGRARPAAAAPAGSASTKGFRLSARFERGKPLGDSAKILKRPAREGSPLKREERPSAIAARKRFPPLANLRKGRPA